MDILSYTREPQEEDIYSPKLAYSMHLAIREEDGSFVPLNRNTGVLYARATEQPDGRLSAKTLKRPCLFHRPEGGFGVMAIRTSETGAPDEESKGAVLLFATADLIHYEECGLVDLGGEDFVEDVVCVYNEELAQYEIRWRDASGRWYQSMLDSVDSDAVVSEAVPTSSFEADKLVVDIGGAEPCHVLTLSDEIGARLQRKLMPLHNVSVAVASPIRASTEAELRDVQALALYNDGSEAWKRVDWDPSGIDWSTPGEYAVTGRVRQARYPFPLAVDRADPCIASWNDRYYFIATTDDRSYEPGFYVRSSETIDGLFDAEEHRIVGNGDYPFLLGVFWWAPELHTIDGRLTVLFAGSSGEFGDIHCYVMRMKAGGDPLRADDWETPIRVQRQDGSYLFENGITLDMTYFQTDGQHYVVWAQRQLTPVDLGSWLYIARLDPQQPWLLVSEPVLLSRPEYSWANNHTFVDEGPYAIFTEDRVHLTFSSALVNATYCVGLLSAARGADLLDPGSWAKGNYPLLASSSVPGQYGPGHNSYVRDEDGNLLNVYHARDGVKGPRCTGIRRVHFDIDGEPVLDLTVDRDLDPQWKAISAIVIVPESHN
ncbi:glycosyl hydrolase [Paenibacillus sp. 598K]|uniref:family 43 glycosylhydrolase n=1 Tax=Paenibacillus sp. 598K TaxID=1117987 RepID=UPI000FFA0FAF|nr:family 43 glycosylhydrolase [Paenibacillus sp. 598K]GBF72728.1 glycosyl hydrolase [Paenibacillus sp. 598K]